MVTRADRIPRPREYAAPVWPACLTPDELSLVDVDAAFLAVDLGNVRRRYRELYIAFRGRIEVRYAMKCNSDPKVLTTLAEQGSGFEIASMPELTALQALGIDTSSVVYSNPIKPPDHVGRSYEAGVRSFAVDCLGEVEKIAKFAPGSNVFARVRVDDTRSLFPLSAKFGLPIEETADLMLAARDRGLVPSGLTFHVGSQCTDASAWARAIDSLAPVIAELSAQGVVLSMLDIGGGFPAHYGPPVPELPEIAARTLEALDRLPYQPAEIICEPGRAIVAESAVLATTVIGRERRLGREWIYLDVGAYNGLMEAAQTHGTWRFPLQTWRGADPDVPHVACTVTGPTCDSSDTLLNDVDLPCDLAIGDRVYIGTAGAYSLCYASSFNGFDPPERIYFGE
ncbi:MAG: type III PLP-dependent enzyme [Mycobacteriales bacterium]